MSDDAKLRDEAWETWKQMNNQCGVVELCAWCSGETGTLEEWLHDRDGFAAFLAKYKTGDTR
jgi:hypothetical protein